MAVAYRKAQKRKTLESKLDLRANTGKIKLVDAHKERKRHSRGINIKKSSILGMFSKKEVMKWQKGSKQHSHMAYTCRHSGTKLCTRARNQFPQRNLCWREQKLGREYKTDTQTIRNCELLKRKPNYKFKKALSFLEML